MPRVTPSRCLRLLLLPWLVVIGLWTFLPSPEISGNLQHHHIQTVLRAGNTLTTVHKRHGSFEPRRGKSRPQNYGSYYNDGALIIDWRLESREDTDSVVLRIGTGLEVNLTRALMVHAQTKDPQFQPYVTGPLTTRVPRAESDPVYSMPWFTWADRMLIDYICHGIDNEIAVMVYVPEPGTVQIWKDIDQFRRYPNRDLDLRESDREFGLLASFANFATVRSTRSSITRIKVSDVKGSLPSRTFPIRSAIISPFYVIMLVVGFVVLDLIPQRLLPVVGPLVGLYMLIVFGFWLAHGLPSFSAWRRRFWMTRWLPWGAFGKKKSRARVWGPSGPVSSRYHESSDDGFYDNDDSISKYEKRKRKDGWWRPGSKPWFGRSSAKSGRFQLPA